MSQLVNSFHGQEINNPKEIKRGESGVEISSAQGTRYYAFPNIDDASEFLENAIVQEILDTNDMVVTHLFEHRTPLQRLYDKIEAGFLIIRNTLMPANKHDRMDDQAFNRLVEDIYGEFDQKRYGMPVELFIKIAETPELQESFEDSFGITYSEYMKRFYSGENMGEALIDGRFI